MSRIPLSDARAGQVLARRVTNAGGMVMVQAGIALTAGMIERLERAGIQAVVIVDADKAAALPDDVRRAFDELFAGHQQDPWMTALKAIVVAQALGQDPDA